MYHNDVLRPAFGGQIFNGMGFGFGVNQVPNFGYAQNTAYGLGQTPVGYGFNPVYGQQQAWGVPAYGYGLGYGYGVNAPVVPTSFAAPSPFGAVAPYGWSTQGLEASVIQHRVDALTGQIAQLTDLVCRTALGAQHGIPAVAGQINGLGLASGRVRESDSHLFWEVAFPGLSMGDLDIEVTGNRVICRTRIPLRNQLRAVGQLELPRGLEIFELPDGRVELNWLVPVSFNGKEVEA